MGCPLNRILRRFVFTDISSDNKKSNYTHLQQKNIKSGLRNNTLNFFGNKNSWMNNGKFIGNVETWKKWRRVESVKDSLNLSAIPKTIKMSIKICGLHQTDWILSIQNKKNNVCNSKKVF